MDDMKDFKKKHDQLRSKLLTVSHRNEELIDSEKNLRERLFGMEGSL